MAFGLAVAPAVRTPQCTLAASLPVLLLLAMAAAVLLATGPPSAGEFRIPNLGSAWAKTAMLHESVKSVAPTLLAYTKNQPAYVNEAGNQFKVSLWFSSPIGALQQDQLESALATAICTATSHRGETVHGVFVPPPEVEPDLQIESESVGGFDLAAWSAVLPSADKNKGGHPFFNEHNFGSKIAYAPGQCSFAESDKLDSEKTATVHIPAAEFHQQQQVVFRLRAFPTSKPHGMAICHPALYAGAASSDPHQSCSHSPFFCIGPHQQTCPSVVSHPSVVSTSASTSAVSSSSTCLFSGPHQRHSFGQTNIDYHSDSGKPGDKPVRSYVFDARNPELRALDPLRSALERPSQMELIEMDIPLAEVAPWDTTQPFYLAQVALIRECADMAKYDGYKWAAFINYDEFLSVGGDKSIEEYADGLPSGTVSVILPRIPPPTLAHRDFVEEKKIIEEKIIEEKQIPFAASWAHTQAQWDVSDPELKQFQFQFQWDVLEESSFAPKYIVNLELADYDARGAGRPGAAITIAPLYIETSCWLFYCSSSPRSRRRWNSFPI